MVPGYVESEDITGLSHPDLVNTEEKEKVSIASVRICLTANSIIANNPIIILRSCSQSH